MGKQKLFVTMRVKNTELMEDVLDIIREHIGCELGYTYISCVISDCDTNHKLLKICIGKTFDENGNMIVRKHMLDSSLCDAIRFNVSEAAPVIIGPYVDENGEAHTSDFFVNENELDKLIEVLGAEEGLSSEKLQRLCADDRLMEKFIGEWLNYVSGEESNLHGKTYFKDLIKKYVI